MTLRKVLITIARIVAVLVIAIALFGICYQFFGNLSDEKRFPQQGKSIALGPDFPGVSLNLYCVGTSAPGTPTVVFDSGLGVPGVVGWDLIQPDIAKIARTCSYDRAGYGWSSASPAPRTSEEIAKELHALLVAAGEKPPYVLVAHSFGGYNVRLYAAKYPQDVAGVVLVDTSHEDQLRRMTPALQKAMADETKSLHSAVKLFPYLKFFGLARYGLKPDPSMKLVPVETQEEVRYLQLQPKFVAASTSEMENFVQSADQVRQDSGNLGDRPLIVLTAGKNPDPKDVPKSFPVDDMNAFHEIWVHDLQVREKNLSTKGQQVIVEDSTHMIPFERPDTVIKAITDVLAATKSQPTPSPASPTKK